MRQIFSANKIDSSGHVAIFYNDPKTLWRLLAEYFKIGFDQGELGVLVTPFPAEDVTQYFKDAGLDVSDQIIKGDLRVFSMTDTYLPEGRFVADFMMNNVLSFIEDAKAQGYNGLRTAGEMGWLEEHPSFHDEAIFYEGNVNRVVGEQPSFTGLCLYFIKGGLTPAADMKSVLGTHPTYFYNGELLKSNDFAA